MLEEILKSDYAVSIQDLMELAEVSAEEIFGEIEEKA